MPNHTPINRLKIKPLDNGIQIGLSDLKRIERGFGYLNIFEWKYCIVFYFALFWYLVIYDYSLTASVFIFACCILFYYGLYITTGAATKDETIIITKDQLTIIQKSFFRDVTSIYNINQIENFRFNEYKNNIAHPLASSSGFDYLGFQTENIAINKLYDDGRIIFDYSYHVVVFGKDIIYSEFEFIEQQLFLISGQDLRKKKII